MVGGRDLVVALDEGGDLGGLGLVGGCIAVDRFELDCDALGEVLLLE